MAEITQLYNFNFFYDVAQFYTMFLIVISFIQFFGDVIGLSGTILNCDNTTTHFLIQLSMRDFHGHLTV